MKVALVDRDQERLTIALQRLGPNQHRMISVCVDMSELNEVHKLAECIEFKLGPPWLVCNSCETSLELNLRALSHGVQVFAPLLARRGEGHIVNLLSADSGSASCPAAYAAAMHAVVGISESLYRELDSLGSLVGVSLVCPARRAESTRILFPQRSDLGSPPVRLRTDAILQPQILAQEIFGAVTTRRFQLSIK
jgi:NAD(P)-dependent dehydrogenase (short-subunit alcohol dehydrogenase family)